MKFPRANSCIIYALAAHGGETGFMRACVQEVNLASLVACMFQQKVVNATAGRQAIFKLTPRERFLENLYSRVHFTLADTFLHLLLDGNTCSSSNQKINHRVNDETPSFIRHQYFTPR